MCLVRNVSNQALLMWHLLLMLTGLAGSLLSRGGDKTPTDTDVASIQVLFLLTVAKRKGTYSGASPGF